MSAPYVVTMADQTIAHPPCANCGEPNLRSNTRAIYCSDRCNSRAYRKRLPQERWADRLAKGHVEAARNRALKPDSPRSWHMRKYGLDAESYDDLLASQDGVCAICGQPETAISPYGQPYRLSVDHNHQTDAVRGLLCRNCNVAVGQLKDDPERAEALARYLRG